MIQYTPTVLSYEEIHSLGLFAIAVSDLVAKQAQRHNKHTEHPKSFLRAVRPRLELALLRPTDRN